MEGGDITGDKLNALKALLGVDSAEPAPAMPRLAAIPAEEAARLQQQQAAAAAAFTAQQETQARAFAQQQQQALALA